MTWKSIPKALVALGFLLALAGQFALADQPVLSAKISADTMRVGDSFTLTLNVLNTPSANFELPELDYIEEVSHTDEGSTINIGGVDKILVTHTVLFIAKKAGVFTVPSILVSTSDGQTLQLKPFPIHILPAGVSAPQNATVNQLNQPKSNAPAGEGIADSGDPDTAPIDRATGEPVKLFCRVIPQTKEGFVGQAIPLIISFYIREDVQANQDSLPSLQGSDFLMESIAVRPDVGTVSAGDYSYSVERWYTSLTPLKVGDLPVLISRETNWAPPQQASAFSILLNPMHRVPTNRETVSNKPPLVFHIFPLPEQGKPADFNGAIGDFQVSGTATPTSVTLGEPVQLQVNISGQGNLGLVTCPSIPESTQWKSFPPKELVKYEDNTHTSGVKSFQISMIPRSTGDVNLPQPSFSYFNPKEHRYYTVPITLPHINVTPSNSPLAQASASTLPDTDPVPEAVKPVEPTFLPNEDTMGTPVASIIPIYQSTAFKIEFALSAFLFTIVFCGCSVYSHVHGSGWFSAWQSGRAGRLETQKHLAELQAALANNDQPALVEAAQLSISSHLAHKWKLPVESVTRFEIERKAPELAIKLAPVLDLIDQQKYSGRLPDSAPREELGKLANLVTHSLKD